MSEKEIIKETIKDCMDDPNLPEEIEEYQKKFGTLTEKDLRETL